MRKVSVLLFCLLLCACGRARQSAALHIVHTGDFAVVTHGSAGEVPLALARSDAHSLARAVETGDTKAVEAMVAAGRALMVPAQTHVRVTGESYNERQVEIADGPQAGRTGWVPFEWLQYQRT